MEEPRIRAKFDMVFQNDDYLTGVTILKQLAVALVAAIKTDGVTREEPSHYRGKRCQTRSEKKMGMIRDEYPCVTGRLGLRQELSQPLEHILPIPIIYEYLSTPDSTDHDVIQDTGCVKAGLAWHGIYFAFTLSLVNLIFYQRPHSLTFFKKGKIYCQAQLPMYRKGKMTTTEVLANSHAQANF